ncbi:MAG: DUF2127 domain-containing protein [Terriglobales bacterium]
MHDTLESVPHGHDHNLQALRAIASFELTKGLVVLFAAMAVLFMVGRDPWDIADGMLRLLHISPDHHFAQIFLNWADTLTDAKLWTVAAVASMYAILRFVEAYGLWYAKTWGEWIALISGSLYLPFEIYKLIDRQSLLHISVFVINVVIVLYMAYLLKTGKGRQYPGHPGPVTGVSQPPL